MDHISHTNIPGAHTLGPARPRFDLATKEGKPRKLLPINHVCFDVVAILSCTVVLALQNRRPCGRSSAQSWHQHVVQILHASTRTD